MGEVVGSVPPWVGGYAAQSLDRFAAVGPADPGRGKPRTRAANGPYQ